MITTILLWILIGVALLVIGIILANVLNYFDFEALGLLMGVIGTIAIGVGIVFGIIMFVERNHEQGYYEACMIEQQTIQTAISNADNVVTAELYDKAIEFNKDLAYKQYLYERGGYIPCSGKYDWSAIPLITIP